MELRPYPASPEEWMNAVQFANCVLHPNDVPFEDWVECRKESLRRQIKTIQHSIDICGDKNGLRHKVLEYKQTELGAIEGCLI